MQIFTKYNILFKQRLTETGRVKNIMVAIKKLGPTRVSITDKKVLLELKIMKDIQHENVNSFIGVCFDQQNPSILMTYCPRGSLNDVLLKHSVNLTWDFKLCLLTDIAQGMKYLHGSEIGKHFICIFLHQSGLELSVFIQICTVGATNIRTQRVFPCKQVMQN